MRMVFMVGKDARRRSPASRSPAQGELERRPLVQAAFAPHATSVAVDDALYQGEPHPDAFELVSRVQALKYAKQPAGVPHVEARAVVPYVIDALAVVIAGADLDQGVRAMARELEGVADEMREDLPQQPAVAQGGRDGRDFYLHSPVRVGLLELLGNRLREGGQVDRL